MEKCMEMTTHTKKKKKKKKNVSKISDIDKISWLILLIQSFQNLSYILSSPFFDMILGSQPHQKNKGWEVWFPTDHLSQTLQKWVLYTLGTTFLISFNFRLFVLAFSF